MADPGDPDAPETPDIEAAVDHDAAVGFSSAAALEGRPRQRPEAEPEPEPEPEPETAAGTDPDPPGQPEVILPVAPPIAPQMAALPEPPIAPPPAPARTTHGSAASASAGPRSGHRKTPGDVEGAQGLFAVYALILFAVPTLGVSALIALVAVTGRPGPPGPVAASHFVFQQRTLWVGAVVALLGGILIAVGLGVFVLFVLALWLILRGAAGVLTLRAGRPVRNPRAWLL